MFKFAVDTMGSDLGPEELAKAILKFVNDYQDVEVYACGDKTKLSLLENNSRIHLFNTTQIVPMECGAMQILRLKDSSMMKAFDLYQENKMDAIVSAGSTAGYLTLATLKLKLIEGVERAALISPFPTFNGNPVVILDIGANNENNASQVVQFAKMGQIYYQNVYGKEIPNLYLISNGTEEKKGSPVSKEAYKMLKDAAFPGFKGNIEGREVLRGEAEVVVCEGFAGNVLLKTVEGTAKVMSDMIKRAFKKNIFTKIGYLLAKKGFDEMSSHMNYKRFGGAMLLGVNGVVVKAHGNSDDYSFYKALEVAYRMAKSDMVNKLKEGFKA